jgi:hypothetical protein
MKKPLGIKIRYRRDIDKSELVESTVEQWRYLGVPEEKQKRWSPILASYWPDILKGDEILYVSDGLRGDFYFQPKNGEPALAGSITDKAFHQAFLSIWLSPDTYYSHVHKRLVAPE